MQKILNVKWWVTGFAVLVFLIMCITYEEHRAANKYEQHRAEYCTANFTTLQQKEACIEEKSEPQDYVPWEIAVFSWPVGITAWAVIGTLFVIGWQSNETRRAAAATEKSVSIARRQIEMIKDKERARVEIKAGSMDLHIENPSFWFFQGGLKVRNLGISRAYINIFQAEIVWFETTSAIPTADFSQYGNIFAESYIDPTEDWDANTSPSLHYFNTDSINLDWFSSSVYEGKVRILMRGAIEYGSVGTRYRRFFTFEWKGHGRPDSWTRSLGGDAPQTNGEKVSAGYWSTEMDEEQEMEDDSPNTT